jgi:hypothetical protein
LTIADAGLSYIARSGGVRSYDLWRLDQINRVVGDRPIARAAEAWTEFKRVRCGGLSPATVQRFKATVRRSPWIQGAERQSYQEGTRNCLPASRH